ncbi:MAG: phosphoglucosamine mutase [Elusimicrobia bacterium]|nr:phosphoglucosamine mutase [Elusimicrobiota bacterium]
MSKIVGARLFGTDGVRGIPGSYPLVPETVRALASEAARLLLKTRKGLNGCAPFVVSGRDTRASGPGLGLHLARGFALEGCRTVDLGVAPTPAVSYLTARLGAFCGVTVSASHNPAEFNGIKFFLGDGLKMPEAFEREIERRLQARRPRGFYRDGGPVPPEDGSPRLVRYAEFLRSVFPATLDLAGLRIVVDCAHGASCGLAPEVLEGLGAEVIRLGCKPDGTNINKGCGALETEAMRRAVVRARAHCGVSFDGDADRAIFCDEKGRIADGDVLIALAALRLSRLGLLRKDRVVLTVMSNLGLVKFLEGEGISSVQVPVGDRNVSDELEREGLSLGGEASGHVIFRCFSPTGDGIITALQTLAAVRESGRTFSRALPAYRVFPLILRNIPVERKVPLAHLPAFARRIRGHEGRLKDAGRIVVRYSGTEPLMRIMVEGPGDALVRRITDDLTAVYLRESGHGVRRTTIAKHRT